MASYTGTQNFGEKRERSATVSYLEVEQAAIGLLLAGGKPSIATVRKALGDRGSSQTIHAALKRFWRDLGLKAQGDPAALSRLPIEIAESVESIWQRALSLASQTATSDGNEARTQLERLKIANEVREQSLFAREKELEAQGRERERLLAETRDHLLSTLRTLSKHQDDLLAKERRVAALQLQVEDYRTQLASVLAAAVSRNQARRAKTKSRKTSAQRLLRTKLKRQRPKGASANKPARRRTR